MASHYVTNGAKVFNVKKEKEKACIVEKKLLIHFGRKNIKFIKTKSSNECNLELQFTEKTVSLLNRRE